MHKNKLVSFFDSGKLQKSSHGSGEKFVFFNRDELQSCVTQIAIGTLQVDEIIPFHIHDSMEEIFYILSGKAIFYIGTEQIAVTENCCVRVPAGIRHSIQALTDFQFYYLGIATN